MQNPKLLFLSGSIHKTGFTMIELLVYSLLFSFFNCALYGFLATMLSWGSLIQKVSKRTISHDLLIDEIRRDLMLASPDHSVCNFDSGIFSLRYLSEHNKSVQKSIMWHVIKKQKTYVVARTEGCFDFECQQWKKKVTTYTRGRLKKIRFSPVHASSRGFIKKILIHWEDIFGKSCTECVALRNRVL